MTAHFTTRSGKRIAYDLYNPTGSAQGSVLLVHGFASNARVNWGNTGWVKTLLAADYQVITFDHRGHGRSEISHDVEDYGTDIMAEDALAVLDETGISKAFVIGYSMGARITASLSGLHPDRVEKAVLAGLGDVLLKGQVNFEAVADDLAAEDPATVTRPISLNFRRFAVMTGSDLKAMSACMRSPRHKVAPDFLSAIEVPTLIVVGDQDDIAGALDPLTQAMPQAKLVILPGKDHMSSVGDKTFKAETLAFFAQA